MQSRQSQRHARLTSIYGACACMIAKQINMANLGYHILIVLYFGDLIRSSFGGLCEHRYIHTSIYVHTDSLLTANKKIDTLARHIHSSCDVGTFPGR
jgi:hypothetical protein